MDPKQRLTEMAIRIDLSALCLFQMREVVRYRCAGSRRRERHAVMAARHYALLTSVMRN